MLRAPLPIIEVRLQAVMSLFCAWLPECAFSCGTGPLFDVTSLDVFQRIRSRPGAIGQLRTPTLFDVGLLDYGKNHNQDYFGQD